MRRLTLLFALGTWLGAGTARAANEDGVPLSPDALLAGMTIAPHDAGTGAWYNPAALGGLPRSSVQVSTSLYTLGIRRIDGLLETRLPWETRHDALTATDFTTIPSGISFTFRLGPHFGLALGVFSPVREYSSFDTQITSISPDRSTTFNESIAWTQRLDATQGGVGLGWAPTDRVRFGLSALLTQSSTEQVVDYSLNATSSTGQLFAGTVLRQLASYFGVRGVFGLQCDAARWLSLALAVRSPILGFAASGKEVGTSYVGIGPSTNPSSTGAFQQTVIDAQPQTMSAPARLYWAAETRFGRIRLAFEGDVRHPIDDSTCGGANQPRCTSGADKWVVNARIGAIVRVMNDFWVGAGAFTDMGGWDLQKSGRAIDYFGGTAGVQFRSPSVIQLRGASDAWDLRTSLAVHYGIGIGQVDSTILDLTTLKATPNPQPGSLTFHEISLNIATALEF